MTMRTILLSLFMLAAGAASAQVPRTTGTFGHAPECLGVEGDGSQTLRVYGNGRNRWDALEQARKDALREVIFSGIRLGKPDCEVKPLVNEVNAREKHAKYFNGFFTDDGPYKEFVSKEDERHAQRVRRGKTRAADGESVSHVFTLRILREELRQRLVTDGILKD